MDAAGVVDAQTAPTTPWKTPAFSTSVHRPFLLGLIQVLTMSWHIAP
jgi:hypothetical protein